MSQKCTFQQIFYWIRWQVQALATSELGLVTRLPFGWQQVPGSSFEVRRDGGDTWKAYLTKLAKEAGIENPTDDQLRNFDRKRKGKKTSIDDWQSPSDPDTRITKMKDGTTNLAYKAEHAVDLKTEIVVAADVRPADHADGETVKDTVVNAQGNLNDATKQECSISEVVADKGYHKTETLAWLRERGIRTYVAPRRDQRSRRWDDKPEGWQEAAYENRRRVGREKGKQLQRRRAEVVERSFAHICTTGGARRTWIRGLAEVSKRYLVTVMAHNLGVILRRLIGVGKPREWASMRGFLAACAGLLSALLACLCAAGRRSAEIAVAFADRLLGLRERFSTSPGGASSTGC